MSMIKVITPGAQDFHEPVAALIKLSSKGLVGVDLRDLEKRASAPFAHEIQKIASSLKDDEPLVHLIAMGSTEAYGANRNGDGFRNEVLRRYHPTFEKYAKFYRSHQNKDPKKCYGHVKLSTHNDPMQRVELAVALNGSPEAARRNGGIFADREMEKLAQGKDIPVSMAARVPFDVCLYGNSLVETRRGLVTINEVNCSDSVRTVDGTFQRVLETFCRGYTGTVVELEVCGALQPLTMTATHPVYVLRQEHLRQCHGSVRGQQRRHTVRNGGDTCETCNTAVLPQSDWLEAREIRVGDYVSYPVQPPGHAAMPAAWAYLAGIYTGDGSIVRSRRGRCKQGLLRTEAFSVTLDHEWPVVKDRVTVAACQVHGRESQPAYAAGNGRKAWQVHVYHRGLAILCKSRIGRGSSSKRLSEKIFQWDREARLHFLGGCLDSDGSVDLKHRNGTGRINFCNRTLAYQVQRLFWGLGLFASYHEETPPADSFGVADYVSVVGLSAAVVAQLAPYSAKAAVAADYRPKEQRQRSFVIGDRMYLRVSRLTQKYDEADVFNLRVAGNETYTAGGYTVHNCSWCGNKSRTRDDYCDSIEKGGSCEAGGLKDNMGALVEMIKNGKQELHQLHADNPDPTFFDISHVFRPADRIAYVTGQLEKAAGCRVMGGAEIAELLGVSMPYELMIDKALPSQTQKMLKLACQLADDEASLSTGSLMPGRIEAFASAFTGTVQESDGATPPAFREKLSHYLRAMADTRIALPLEKFIELTADCGREKAAAVAAAARPWLPDVYNRMLSRGDLAERLASNPYMPGPGAAPTIRLWAEKQAAAWALDEARVGSRALRSAMRGEHATVEAPPLTKSAADNTAARDMAEQYALYKLAFLGSLPDDSHLPLTRTLSIIQNYANQR